jgi:hypothetical protein
MEIRASDGITDLRTVELGSGAMGMKSGRALAIGALGTHCLDEDSVRGSARVANDPDIEAVALIQPCLDESLRDELAAPISAETPAGSLTPRGSPETGRDRCSAS